jgi:hypothetical protein
VCSNQLFIIQNAEKRSIDGILSNVKNGSTPGYWKSEVKINAPAKQDMYVVGDKTGHRTVDYLINNPAQLDSMKNITPWPIKWIHVVRNPFDNIATWTKKNFNNRKKRVPSANIDDDYRDAFKKYKSLNAKIKELKGTEDVLTVLHEKVIRNPDKTMKQLCSFLGIEMCQTWRVNVRKTLWKKPRITRRQIRWTPNMRQKVMALSKEYPWLKGYAYGG